jgi:molybdopterin molybdotransferase
MISVDEARKLIADKCKRLQPEYIPLVKAVGYVLAEDIYCTVDTPPFDQAAVDGYAFSFAGWDKNQPLTIDGQIQAGSSAGHPIPQQHAVKIFTGAPIPPGTDTVVMVEKTERTDDTVLINDPQIIRGANVRLKGSQTRIGEKALSAGHNMNPASVSFLASLGIGSVNVYARPKVRIIVTGNELVPPGVPLKDGKIYESNSAGLIAALKVAGIKPLSVEVIDDQESAIMHAINRSSDANILILTGGASVGDYDFVPSALTKCGVLKIFHKVKQKPGKPLFFGMEDDLLAFGLPGNPAAVLTCFYEYILPVIAVMSGIKPFEKTTAVLENGARKKGGLTYFLKGRYTDGRVTILESQESYLMNSFAHANCLIELEEDREAYDAGETVKILPFQ